MAELIDEVLEEEKVEASSLEEMGKEQKKHTRTTRSRS
jgi:hypothetical protein